MKVAKEEIMGLITALQVFVEEDEEAETRRYNQMCDSIVDALVEVPGLRVTTEHDGFDYHIPTAVLTLTTKWNGPSRDEVLDAMLQGDPPISLRSLGSPDELAVEPLNLDDHDLETVIRRLRQELLNRQD